jgi:hypothetical protein
MVTDIIWTIEKRNPKDLKEFEKNPRKITKEEFEALKKSIEKRGFHDVIKIDLDGTILSGNMRKKALIEMAIEEVDVKVPNRILTEDERDIISMESNLHRGIWDNDRLLNEWNIDNLLEAGWTKEQLSGFVGGEVDDVTAGERKVVAKKVLSEMFIVPPMSTFNTKRDYWQNRKQKWIDLGLASFKGREGLETSGSFSGTVPGYYDFKNKKEEELGRAISHKEFEEKFMPELIKDSNLAYTDTGGLLSIFDPVLTEIIYRWFTPAEGGVIVDPFAGGSVRGIVANFLGYDYQGVDLSKEQIDANVKQADEILTEQKKPNWVVGNSLNIDTLLPEVKADLVFSCPPYYDLEVYCDDKEDLSNQEWEEFLKNYREIIKKSCAILKDDRFACFVVSEVRNKDGNGGEYRNFVGETIRAFKDAGLNYYNEFILLNAFGSAAIRAKKQFNSTRKNVRVHQNVLVFYKGDVKNIKGKFPELDFSGMEDLLEKDEEPDETGNMF